MVIWWDSCFWCHSCLYNMQGHSYLGKKCPSTTLVTTRLRLVSTQIMTKAFKNSLTFTYPTNIISIRIWVVLQFWHPWISLLIPLSMLIIDSMHSPIYQTNTNIYNSFSINLFLLHLLLCKFLRIHPKVYNFIQIWWILGIFKLFHSQEAWSNHMILHSYS